MSLAPEASNEQVDLPSLEPLEAAIAAEASRVRIDRMTLLAGWSRHGLGEETAWEERHARLHFECTAASTGLRLSILRGGAGLDDIDPREIGALARSLAAVRPWRDRAPEPIAIASPVAAALAAAARSAIGESTGVRLVQAPHPSFPRDGNGNVVGRVHVGHEPAPNQWRPSYRAPAVPAFLHVEIEPSEESAPPPDRVILETLGPIRIRESRARMAALIVAGERAGAATVELDLARLAPGEGEPGRRWYPFGAGAWGRVLVCRNARIIGD